MKVNNKSMREKVVELCRKDPSLVDDDTRLIANMWWQEGWKDKNLCEHLKSVSSPETIRRTRQKLVEEGVLKPSATTRFARKQEEKRARSSLGY